MLKKAMKHGYVRTITFAVAKIKLVSAELINKTMTILPYGQ